MATGIEPRLVTCASHGQRRPAFVCKHITEQLADSVPRGAVWIFDPDDQSFTVYCSACDRMLASLPDEVDGIPEEISELMGHKMICEVCMDQVLHLNGLSRLN